MIGQVRLELTVTTVNLFTVSLLNQLGKLPITIVIITLICLPKDVFEPITNEIFSQVHYQLCYFGFELLITYMEIAGIEPASQ